jgi:hypothetical protein
MQLTTWHRVSAAAVQVLKDEGYDAYFECSGDTLMHCCTIVFRRQREDWGKARLYAPRDLTAA